MENILTVIAKIITLSFIVTILIGIVYFIKATWLEFWSMYLTFIIFLISFWAIAYLILKL